MVSDQLDLGRIVSEASVQVKVGNKVHHTAAEASGPVDALSEALNKAIAPVFPQINDVRLVQIIDASNIRALWVGHPYPHPRTR